MLRKLLSKMDGLFNRFSSNLGFTLIELLIVIVIIGILAGVLLAVIDPAAQQNRARDANVRADLNKLGLAIGSFISANGVIPRDNEVLSTFVGYTEQGSTCASGTDNECWFTLDNSALPSVCSAVSGGTLAPYSTAGTTACSFLYRGGSATLPSMAAAVNNDATSPHFRIFSRAYGSNNLYVYGNWTGKMYRCALDGTACTAF